MSKGVIHWFGASEKIIGFTLDKLNNIKVSDWKEYVHPDDWEAVSKILRETLFAGKEISFKFRLKQKNGNYVLVEQEGQVVVDTSGNITVIGSIKNITKRSITNKILETQIHTSELLSKSIKLTEILLFISDAIDDIFFGKYKSSFIILDPHKQSVKKSISKNIDTEFLKIKENFVLSEGNGAFVEACFTQEKVVVEDISKSAFFAKVAPTYEKFGLQSVVSYPIINKKNVCVACLNIYQENTNSFLDRDLEYLDQIVNIVQSVFDNQSYKSEKQRFSRILEKASNLVIITDEQARITWINESVTNLTRYTLEELIGINILDFPGYKLNSPSKVKKIERSQQHLLSYDVELYNISKNGTPYWVEINGSPYYDDEGKFKGYIQIESDITEKKHSMAKLDESQKLLQSITSNISEGIYRSTPNQGIIFCNPAFVRLFGYENIDEVLKTDTPMLYVNPKDRDIVTMKLEQFGMLVNEEVYLHRKDGSKFWGVLNTRSLIDQNGEVFYDGVVKDISYLKSSEEQLKSYNTQLESIMNALNISSFVSITDKQGHIQFINDRFCDIIGYSRENIIGKTHNILNSNYHTKEFWQSLWTTVLSGNSWRGEIRNKDRYGNFIWFDTTISPLKDENGNVEKFLAIRSDITDRKKNEEEIKRLNEVLEEKVLERTALLNDALEEVRLLNTTLYETNQNLVNLNEEKNEFVGIVAHDLKNPIQGIMFAAELVKTHIDKVSTEQILYNMDFIEKTSKRMRDMINNFLSASAIDVGKVSFNYENFNISNMLSDLVEAYRPIAEKKQVTLLYTPVSVFSKIDKSALTQVCENLLSNAIKFSPKNKRVEVRVDVTDDTYMLSFIDEGPGLTTNDKQNLFKKYAKLSAKPTAGESSTGLGLSIVKKLVELMNGKIGYISEEGEGTTFYIEMPIKRY